MPASPTLYDPGNGRSNDLANWRRCFLLCYHYVHLGFKSTLEVGHGSFVGLCLYFELCSATLAERDTLQMPTVDVAPLQM